VLALAQLDGDSVQPACVLVSDGDSVQCACVLVSDGDRYAVCLCTGK
jgi:hypothetical protein